MTDLIASSNPAEEKIFTNWLEIIKIQQTDM